MHRLILFAALATKLVAMTQGSLSPGIGKHFIVELDHESSPEPHKRFYSHVKSKTDYDLRYEYNISGVFVGASISLDNVIDLSSAPGVKAVHSVGGVFRPKTTKAVFFSGSDDLKFLNDTESTHIMTGVDKVHAQGITGKGITVGIIDTGVDYNHPLLGKGFGPGHKVKGGFDFVGDDYNGTNAPVPDPDPLDECDGHGTHVAGILAADPDRTLNISGVAYEANIMAYRVLGCAGVVTNDVLLAAILRAFQDKGISVTVADGNDGSDGPWDASSPATGRRVIAVNSVVNSVTIAHVLTTSDPTHQSIPYFGLSTPPVEGSFPIYATSTDTTILDDACDPLPDSTPDLSNMVAVVRRGTCPFTTKLQNVADKGGNLTLIYNTDDTSFFPSTDNFLGFGITGSDGVFLVNQFAANKNITVSFPQTAPISIPNPEAGTSSTFNTWGPTYDLFQKPQISSPGENILSTFPIKLGSFSIMSGTSMATPFIAGCVALIMQVEGKGLAVAQKVSGMLQTSAQLVPASNNDSRLLQTATSQGAGLVNVYKALTTRTLLTPSELLLNDTKHFVRDHTITITNLHKTPETYEIQHLPAGTANTMNGTLAVASAPVLTKGSASVHLSHSRITVAPGKSVDVRVRIDAPKNLDAKSYPTYSGFLVVTGNRYQDEVHTTYTGVVGDMKAMKIIDDTDIILGMKLPAILDASGNIQVKPTNYTFIGNDTPTFSYRLAAGSPLVVIDLVDANSKDSQLGSPVVIGNVCTNTSVARNAISDDPEANSLQYQLPLTTTFTNGTQIPEGSYQLLLQALKITGNPHRESDYETFLSPTVGFFTNP